MVGIEATRAREIVRVLSFYDGSLTPALALVISESERLPEELNNQVRNAFTHLVRILAAQSEKIATSEADKSIGHLDRATRDCIKIVIIQSSQQLSDNIIDAKYFGGSITPEIQAEHREILSKRRQIYVDETKGDNHTSPKLSELAEQIEQLNSKIVNQYLLKSAKASWFKRFYRRHHKWLFLVLGALAYAVIRNLFGDTFAFIGATLGM